MKLILITGAPASGKSSIANKLGEKLNIKVISKDEFKIQLFEKYGFNSNDEKKKISSYAEKSMYNMISEYSDKDIDLIVDNNFKKFDDIIKILNKKSKEIVVICIYCKTNYNLLVTRYNERNLSGNRHEALYTLNVYPIVEGRSVFHPCITIEDIRRMEEEISEKIFGENVLVLRTDNIDKEYDYLCNKAVMYIQKTMEDFNDTL